MSIKYYHLAKDEEPPEEFCVVKDVGGEPSEYVFYVQESENAKLRELVVLMYRDMQGVLDMSTDTVWVDDIGTLRDAMDYHMQDMAELGMPPADYERRIRELGIEVDA